MDFSSQSLESDTNHLLLCNDHYNTVQVRKHCQYYRPNVASHYYSFFQILAVVRALWTHKWSSHKSGPHFSVNWHKDTLGFWQGPISIFHQCRDLLFKKHQVKRKCKRWSWNTLGEILERFFLGVLNEHSHWQNTCLLIKYEFFYWVTTTTCTVKNIF